MMINRYIISAALIILVVFASYFINFYVILGYEVSSDSALWAQLGDYAGGMLNPLLSFISIVLLIKSLTLQNEANISLRQELKGSEKTEKLRSFEALYFNMIDSQKKLFESFKIDFDDREASVQLANIKAVIEIEDEIGRIRDKTSDDSKVQEYLNKIDSYDQIFGLSRAFYIMVIMVHEKLSDSEGFTSKDRKSHFQTLINFTDFAQIRLIMICVQFMKYESTAYLKNSSEFKETIESLGLSYELY